jgi:hypothetical protein
MVRDMLTIALPRALSCAPVAALPRTPATVLAAALPCALGIALPCMFAAALAAVLPCMLAAALPHALTTALFDTHFLNACWPYLSYVSLGGYALVNGMVTKLVRAKRQFNINRIKLVLTVLYKMLYGMSGH